MQNCFKYVESSRFDDCVVWEIHINNLKHYLLCSCVVDITEGDVHSQLSQCHHLFSSEAIERKSLFPNLIFELLYLLEGLGKYDACCIACVDQDIVHYKAFDDISDNNGIPMWIILEMKIILRKGNRGMRPHSIDVGSLDTYMLLPSLGIFLLFLVARFEA
jgi:hypothetical protein